MTAAELNENKNQKVVIEALARLNDDNIYYSICGKGPNEDNLRALIKSKGLEERVRLLGYRTDMDEILQTADVFAFPSIREGLGVAAVEALMCNIPVIAADNRGTREYVSDGSNGIVCSYDDAEEFKDAIELLYKDSAYRERMADRCRASVSQFTVEEVEKTMIQVYSKALGESR